MKFGVRLQIVLHFFVGLGAFFGGLSMVLNPLSPLGVGVEVLKNGPFTDFFIPGLFLLLVLGIANLACGVWTLKKAPLYEYCGGFEGALLTGWITVQCFVLQAIVSAHVLFFLIGTVQGICSLFLLFYGNKFPFNLVRRFFAVKK